MYYLIQPKYAKIIALSLIPLLTIIFLIINTTTVLARNSSNGRTNQSLGRNGQTLSEVPTRSTDSKTSQKISLTSEEARICKLINQERAKAGLPQLEIDPILTKLARDKSLDMVSHNYFGHNSERSGTIHDQLEIEGISYCNAAENLAGGPNILKTHRRLLSSSAHRSNILNPKFKRIGVGIVNGGAYGKMMTQIFID